MVETISVDKKKVNEHSRLRGMGGKENRVILKKSTVFVLRDFKAYLLLWAYQSDLLSASGLRSSYRGAYGFIVTTAPFGDVILAAS